MMSKSLMRGPTAVIASLALGATLSLAGCGAGEDKTNAGDNVSLPRSDQEQLDLLYKGTSVPPASEAPAPKPGMNVWIISPGQSVDIVSQVTSGMADAAKAIGWRYKIFDAQLQPTMFLQGVQQAIAAKADGIMVYAIDCANIKTGLQKAKDAGIPVVGATAQDCPDEHLMTELTFEAGSFTDLSRSYGMAGALWLVSQSASNAKFIELAQFDTASTKLASDGYREALERTCPKCTNVPVEFTGGEIGPKLQQKVQQALVQHPDAVGLYASFDALLTSGVAAAVMSSGRADEIKVIGGGASEPNLDLIRENRGQDADVAYPSRWEGFAAVDYLNRLLNGETPTNENAPTGIGIQLVDEDHNLPPSGPVELTVDYEAAYLEAWGINQ